MKLSLAWAAAIAVVAVACAASDPSVEAPPPPATDPINALPGTSSSSSSSSSSSGSDGGGSGDAKPPSTTESAGPNDVCPGVEIALTGSGSDIRKGTISGTTAQLFGHYAGACGGATGRDAVYVVKPDVTGILTAKIASGFDSVLYARRTCDEAKTEAACNDAPGAAGGEEIRVPVTKEQLLFLFVDGYSGAAGTFSIDVSVTAAFCGNGVAEPPEACDDGNNVAGDGCAANCTFESGGDINDCPGQTVTLAGSPSGNPSAERKVSFAGDTTNLPTSTLTALGCSSSGPNAVYSIVPDVDGSLTAKLVASYDNAALYIRSECDTSSSENQLDCKESTEPLEPLTITVPVRKGLPHYVVVDSSSSTYKGTYTLDVVVRPGACGNKILEGNEECDDGNTASGDGCTATCTLEPVPASADTCPGSELPLVAVAGGTYAGIVTSSTATLNKDHKPKTAGNLCSTSIDAKDAVFHVTSPISGLLEATVVGAFDSTIYARSACVAEASATAAMELACSGAVDGNGAEKISVPIVAGAPVYLFVDSEVAAGQGVFELSVLVKPGACGNGVVEGGEQCDDGNAASGDGCSATCQLEAVTGHDTCANADPITLVAGAGGAYAVTIVSGTTNLAHDQTFSGCASAGPDAIFAVTAPIDGVLTAEVPVASFNVSLGGRLGSACPPSTTATLPIACSNVSSDNGLEEISFSVSQGQTYYLIVDGATSTSKGTFTMLVNVRPPGCGDGLVSGVEQCDDGNLVDGDGCSSTCTTGTLTGIDTCPGYTMPLSGSGTTYTGVVTVDTSGLAPNYAGSCGGSSKDGVIAITPPINGKITAKVTGIDYQPVLYVRSTCGDPLTQKACDDDQPSATTMSRDVTVTGVVAGTTYYLFIDGYNGGAGKSRVNVTVTP